MSVRIVGVGLYRVALPLVHEFESSSHRKAMLEHVLVRLRGADGTEGWGEIASPSAPYFGAETVETCWTIARGHVMPAVLGAEWERPEDLFARMARIRGNNFARAGFDVAAWDLWAMSRGVPLAVAIGGLNRAVPAGVSLGIEPTIDALLEQVERHIAGGYRRVKLKIKPGWDVVPAKAVREAFPDVAVHVDANGIYEDDRESAGIMALLDDLGLAMIEQPHAPRDLLAHAALQGRIGTAVCLDESVESKDDLETALALGACRALNVKVSRLGGLTPAIAVVHRAAEAGVLAWCGGMHEFGIGRAANVALCALIGPGYPSDVSAGEKYYAEDLVTPAITATDGLVTVPDAPGIGHRIVPERLLRSLRDSAEFGEIDPLTP